MDKLEKAAREAVKAYDNRELGQPKQLRRTMEALAAALPDPRDELLAAADNFKKTYTGRTGYTRDGVSMVEIRAKENDLNRLFAAVEAYKQSKGEG